MAGRIYRDLAIRLRVFATIGVIMWGAHAAAQASASAFAEWASRRAMALRTVELTSDMSDLWQLRPVIGSARIVALGEPFHGYHEPLAFRNRLFSFLVKEMGFTAIAIETGFAEVEGIQNILAGGPGDVERVVRDSLTYRFGRFQENQALVEWMRDYNTDTDHRRKLHFYGIDISLGGPRTATPTPVGMERVLSYVSRVDPELVATLRERVQPLFARLRVTNPESFSERERDALSAAADELMTALERHRSSLISHTSSTEYEWVHQCAVSAEQAIRVFRLMPPPDPGAIPPSAWRQMTVRDESMAENVKWVLAREGSNGKVVIFAHNTHIQDAVIEGGVWANLEQPPRAMGQYLREALGNAIAIVATTAATITNGQASTADPGTVEGTLAGLRRPLLALDLRLARDDSNARQWLAERHSMNYEIVPPGQAFDALVFMDRLTPAR